MALGGFNELDFLLHIPILNNDDNRDSIYNWFRGTADIDAQGNVDANSSNKSSTNTVVFKSKQNNDTQSIKNYYKDSVYRYSVGDKESDLNPYLKLIRDFSKDKAYNAMRFDAADFAYLTDLGVYPINRMWVLRRWSDTSSPPNNLQDWSGDPVSPLFTMVGWIKPEQDKFFSMSFNENWTKITERLDQVIFKILEEEFGLKASSVISLPGWSQGLLFGFLKEMGITDYNAFDIPQGNPAVLQEAASRAADSKPGYGNVSEMNLTLNTSYEQKFIGDIDPGSAMLDIIYNCTYMGTRNTEYVLRGGAGQGDVLAKLRAANSAGNDVTAWWEFIVSVITAFKNALVSLFKDVFGGGQSQTANGNNQQNSGQKKEGDANNSNTPTPDAALAAVTGPMDFITNGANDFLKSILTSTVRKWRYAMMGSIALMTGENSTPWHLTLGNPYSPFVSLGNVLVKSVNLNFNNEFGFNDIPTKLDVEISVNLGRNLGAQEIFQMFNNGYQRAYANPSLATSSGPAPEQNSVNPVTNTPNVSKSTSVTPEYNATSNVTNSVNSAKSSAASATLSALPKQI